MGVFGGPLMSLFQFCFPFPRRMLHFEPDPSMKLKPLHLWGGFLEFRDVQGIVGSRECRGGPS